MDGSSDASWRDDTGRAGTTSGRSPARPSSQLNAFEPNDNQSPTNAQDGRDDCCAFSGRIPSVFRRSSRKIDASEDFNADPYPDEGDDGEDDPDEDDRPDGGSGIL